MFDNLTLMVNNMTSSKAKTTKVDAPGWASIKSDVLKELTNKLKKVIEMQAFEIEDELDSDLFNTPVVDSKTVIKLTPLFEKLTGHQIDVKWIKEGGYESVEEAITNLIENFENDID